MCPILTEGAMFYFHLNSPAPEAKVVPQRSLSIPAAPSEETDLLESLLSNHANPSLTEIEQLIELQDTLFGNSRTGGGGGGGEAMGGDKNKIPKFIQHGVGQGSPECVRGAFKAGQAV